MNKIIFDTNFLFTTFQFNVDVINEIKNMFGKNYKLYIYSGTLIELENLKKKKTKNKKYIPLIMKMLKIYNFEIIKNKNDYVDEVILNNLNEKIIIATNDKELRKKIKEKNPLIKIILLRQKNYLIIQ